MTLILVALRVTLAEAQSPQGCSPPSAYALLRQDEDYSYLKDRACHQDFWDPVKFIPFNSEGDRYLRRRKLTKVSKPLNLSPPIECGEA
jgi:hypothetical protein